MALLDPRAWADVFTLHVLIYYHNDYKTNNINPFWDLWISALFA